MHTKTSIPSVGEIVFIAAVVVLISFLVFASNKRQGDTSTATLWGKLSFFFIAAIAIAIGTVLAMYSPHHNRYALHSSPQEIAAIEAEGGPTPLPRTGPRIQRSSAARAGDRVTIVCETSVCGITPTAQTAQEVTAHPKGAGSGVRIKSGTKAIVTLYDPEYAQTDTAKVDIIPDDTDTQPAIIGWIPGKWMHKLPEQTP